LLLVRMEVGVAEGCAHIFALVSDKTARVLEDSKGWDVRQQLAVELRGLSPQ
jgi:hypothetical protein